MSMFQEEFEDEMNIDDMDDDPDFANADQSQEEEEEKVEYSSLVI